MMVGADSERGDGYDEHASQRGLIPISMFSATISPSKGKGKDGGTSTTWRPGWWDFLPLADTARRYVTLAC